MLVKLAFVMQRLKKYIKKFCHDQQRLGGGQFLDFIGGDRAVMRGTQSSWRGVPPLGKTLSYQCLCHFICDVFQLKIKHGKIQFKA